MPKFVDDLNVQGAVAASGAANSVTHKVQAAAGQTVDLEQWLASDGTTVLGKIDVNGAATVLTVTVTGLTGATSSARFAGATTSGAPASGTFVVGDYVVDRSGRIYVCTTGGSPGTWTRTDSGNLVAANNLSDVANAATARTNLGAAAVEGSTAPPSTNTTGSVLGTAATAAHSDHTHAVGTHDHSTTAKGGQITPTTGLAATGTPSGTTFLRGDNTWSTPAGGGSPGMAMRFAAGRYVVNNPGGVTTGSVANLGVSAISFVPVTFPRALTLTTIGIEVTTAVASSAVRLGLYTDSNGIVGGLVADFGTVDSTTTGVKTITISQAVSSGDYWLAAVQQGGASAVNVRATTAFGLASDSRSTVPTSNVSGSLETNATGFTGALPSTVTISNGQSAGMRFLLGV